MMTKRTASSDIVLSTHPGHCTCGQLASSGLTETLGSQYPCPAADKVSTYSAGFLVFTHFIKASDESDYNHTSFTMSSKKYFGFSVAMQASRKRDPQSDKLPKTVQQEEPIDFESISPSIISSSSSSTLKALTQCK